MDRIIHNATLLALPCCIAIGPCYADKDLSLPDEDESDHFQINRLFKPDPHDLVDESKGQVFIYDGLVNDQVNLALDVHFDRIENIMFVRTRFVQPDGKVVKDDDCD